LVSWPQQHWLRAGVCCQEHGLRLDAEELGGLKIGQDDYLGADKILRRVSLGDAGHNLAGLAADIYIELEKLIRAFYTASRLYLSDA
jgi:hypothetical protein